MKLLISNFSAHSIIYKGIRFATVEHAYQWAKFDSEKIKGVIKNAESPIKAFELGKFYKSERKQNWDELKVEVLYEIIKEKVTQHEEVRNALLATSDEEIVEDCPNDDFWGNGSSGKGQNQIGKILMKIREEIKNQK